MTSPKWNASSLSLTGITRDQVRAIQRSMQQVTVDGAKTYYNISTDAGATWSPVATTASLSVTFYRDAKHIATQIIIVRVA